MTRILLVEDDPAAAELLAITLQRAGHEVVVVATGVEAMQSIQHGVSCVLLDLGLPDIDGLRVCADIRHERPGLPIMVVSARASEADAVVALNAGADDYVVKPFRANELVARVAALLRRTNTGDQFTVGDITIDVTTFRARVGDHDLQLTPKEFEILTLLARNFGAVVNRSDIVAALWHTPLPKVSKSLDMHLSSLRRKLQAAGSRHTIATARGLGFALQG